MNAEEIVRASKFLSRHLRHRPERLGLTLAPGGWVEVDCLLRACAEAGFPLTRDELDTVVRENDKGRFSFDPTGARVRANQGHSVEIDLQLRAMPPPATLYHGTGRRAVPAIVREGLRKMRRHHVHLSADVATARTVGARHGPPAIFAVDAAAMVREGTLFYRSENGVWLVDAVAPRHLRLLENAPDGGPAAQSPA